MNRSCRGTYFMPDPFGPGKPMLFFHYTHPSRASSISREGLSKGTIPPVQSAQWLTLDPRWENQTWSREPHTLLRLSIWIPHNQRHGLVQWNNFRELSAHRETLGKSLLPPPNDAWWLFLGKIPRRWITLIMPGLHHPGRKISPEPRPEEAPIKRVAIQSTLVSLGNDHLKK